MCYLVVDVFLCRHKSTTMVASGAACPDFCESTKVVHVEDETATVKYLQCIKCLAVDNSAIIPGMECSLAEIAESEEAAIGLAGRLVVELWKMRCSDFAKMEESLEQKDGSEPRRKVYPISTLEECLGSAVSEEPPMLYDPDPPPPYNYGLEDSKYS